MKKFLSIILCASIIMTTGCSGISLEDYNSLVVENSKLSAENDQLKDELEEIKTAKDKLGDCFDVCTKMLGLPKSAVYEEKPNQVSRGLYKEFVFYLDNDEISSKTIISFDSSLSAKEIAPYIKVYVDGVADGLNQTLQQRPTSTNGFIYRYGNGKVIMSQYRYVDDDGTVKSPIFFTSYGLDVADELAKLYEEEEASE